MLHPPESDAWHQGTFWILDLGQPLPAGPVPQVPVALLRAGPEVAQELAWAMDLDDHTLVAQRFERGLHCYIARLAGKLVTYGWVTFDEEDIGELGLSFRLKAAEAYIWNCATLPTYRGRHFYPALLSYIAADLFRQGIQRIWIGTDADNQPSQRGIILAGGQPVVDVFIKHASARRQIWLQGRPGIAEQLVMDVRQALLGGRAEI